jgi:hypothetical protein
MNPTIDINKIADYLKTLSVNENYKWKLPSTEANEVSIFDDEDLSIILNCETDFDANVKLKTMLEFKISNNLGIIEHEKNIFEWIVYHWGGIKRGRETVFQIGHDAIKTIESKPLDFYRIASTSKILSFYNPKKYVIYDARVAHSLNTIMLLENASSMFFPMPDGRNPKMKAFDIEVLIRLKNISFYNRNENRKMIANADRNIFFSEKDAYALMNKTIIDLNKKIYEDDEAKAEYPFYTEMLLFGIADTLIYDRIINEYLTDYN